MTPKMKPKSSLNAFGPISLFDFMFILYNNFYIIIYNFVFFLFGFFNHFLFAVFKHFPIHLLPSYIPQESYGSFSPFLININSIQKKKKETNWVLSSCMQVQIVVEKKIYRRYKDFRKIELCFLRRMYTMIEIRCNL